MLLRVIHITDVYKSCVISDRENTLNLDFKLR